MESPVVEFRGALASSLLMDRLRHTRNMSTTKAIVTTMMGIHTLALILSELDPSLVLSSSRASLLR